MRLAALILCAGCTRAAAPAPLLSNKTEPVEPELLISATAVGPIDATAKATLTSLRARLVGYEVRPVNDGSLEYDVFSGGERLMFIVPDSDDGGIFNIHAVSARIGVEGRRWRVGAVFRDAALLTACECWGDHPTCFVGGEHVAVNFARSCEGLTSVSSPRALRVLDGLTIERVIWSPSAFGHDEPEEDRD